MVNPALKIVRGIGDAIAFHPAVRPTVRPDNNLIEVSNYL
jgi:hypothetical protein